MPFFTVESTGHIKSFAGSVAPAGYLICDGAIINRADYPSLFQIIGTTFNTSGEASTQFRLPDLRGKARMGSGQDSGRGLTTRTLGQYLGAETHTLTTAELPSHTHSGTTDTSADAHTHTGTSDLSGTLQHTHQYLYTWNRGNANNCSGGRPVSGVNYPQSSGSTVSLVHNHNVTIGTKSGTHIHDTYTTSSTGGGSGHNNMMPSLVLNYCIKF